MSTRTRRQDAETFPISTGGRPSYKMCWCFAQPPVRFSDKDVKGAPLCSHRILGKCMKEMNTAANHCSLFTGSFSKPGLCLSGLWRRGGKPIRWLGPGSSSKHQVLLLNLQFEKRPGYYLSFLEVYIWLWPIRLTGPTEKHDPTAGIFLSEVTMKWKGKDVYVFKGKLLCSLPA